jgi:flavodoxin I
MKILLAYASNSGGTFLSGKIIKEVLGEKHSVEMKKIENTGPSEFQQYDLVIFGSPSWDFGENQGQPHETFLKFIALNKNLDLNKKRFAVYGCGDTSYTYFCGAVDNLEKFIKESNGELIIKPLKINGYFFNLEENNKLVRDWAQKVLKATEDF